MDAIAAVVIGGTRLTGGEGGAGLTLVGVLLFGIVFNLINLEGTISSWWQGVLRGAFLLGIGASCKANSAEANRVADRSVFSIRRSLAALRYPHNQAFNVVLLRDRYQFVNHSADEPVPHRLRQDGIIIFVTIMSCRAACPAPGTSTPITSTGRAIGEACVVLR